MQGALRWLQARADDVAVVLLTGMFLAFLLQITSRYVFNHPLSWTLELCLTLWLWTVFWGSAFCLKNDEHIRFDLLYLHVKPGPRRVFAAISAIAIIVAMLVSLPGTWSFVTFLTIKKSATMRIPLAYVFGIYIVFMVAVVALYSWRLRQIFKNQIEPVHQAHPAP